MAKRTARRLSGKRWAITLVAGALLGAPLAGATTIKVTHLVDDANIANGTCTLREAIRAANGNVAVDACPAGQSAVRDEIVVIPGVHQVNLAAGINEDLAVTGDLDLRGSVRIRGASSRHTIVDGNASTSTDRLFQVLDLADDVVLEGIALRGGNANDLTKRGGLVWNQETGANDVELIDVEISGGQAATGGGIYNEGNLNLQRCRVVDNRTTDVPATAGNHGGGIASAATAVALRIEDSEIRRNRAEEDGAGVWVGGGTFVAHRSRITDNVAGQNGGGLAVSANNFEVHYAELSRNQAAVGGGVHMATQGEIQRSAFVDNAATVRGGGVHDVGSGFVRFSTFTRNSAPQGAGVYADSNQTLLDADTIAENQGGGVFNQRGLFLENVLLARNTGGNCTGNPPAFGAFNLDHANSCGFAPTPTGPNFPNTDPKLGPLADNGGPTKTMALLPGSPGIDVVTSEIRTNCQNMFDQRGRPRGRPRTKNAQNEDVYLCDLGAYEVTTPFVVDTLADGIDADLADDRCLTAGGACTLRAAIQQANAIPGLDEIALGTGVHTLSIPGTGENAAATGDLDLLPPVSIRGAGTALTSVTGAGLDRVFEIVPPLPPTPSPPGIGAAPVTTFLRDLTITGGDAGIDNGGGIALRSALRLERARLTANDGGRGSAMSSSPTGFSFLIPRPLVEIVDSTVDANPGGGALFLSNAVVERSSLINNVADGGHGGAGEFLFVRFENSTVSGNRSVSEGGIFAQSALIESSTFYDNQTSSNFGPGGVFLLDQSVFRNSIIANNRAGGGSVLANCSANPAGIFSFGHNVTDGNGVDCLLDDPTDQLATDPQLAPLANNGGATLTHQPLAGSLAIDRGDAVVCPTMDQRGTPRPRDGNVDGSAICDVGAVEVPEPALVASLVAGVLALAGVRRSARPVFVRALARDAKR